MMSVKRDLDEAKEAAEAREPRRRPVGAWLIVGGAAVFVVALAIALRAGGWNRAPARYSPGHIEWRLSVFSNNTIQFRPSLAILPRFAHGK